MPSADPSAELLGRLRVAVVAARDPARAASATAYMRNQFPYAGVTMPRLTAIYRAAVTGLTPPAGEAELGRFALACWEQPEREYQYLGVRHLRRHVRLITPAFLPTLERLITTRPWWDTVDELAVHVAGDLVARHPELRTALAGWLVSDDIWLARTAILHQERWKERTDAGVLFDWCLRRSADREFFIRKAIGWALRSYAKVAPEAVAAFLDAHGGELSALSRREAERGVDTGRRGRPAPA
jgi:3-methyladenine DNA glycosylase AlkD